MHFEIATWSGRQILFRLQQNYCQWVCSAAAKCTPDTKRTTNEPNRLIVRRVLTVSCHAHVLLVQVLLNLINITLFVIVAGDLETANCHHCQQWEQKSLISFPIRSAAVNNHLKKKKWAAINININMHDLPHVKDDKINSCRLGHTQLLPLFVHVSIIVIWLGFW